MCLRRSRRMDQPVTVTTTTSGQNARVVFEGTAGQRVGLIMSAVTISSSAVSILNPDGSNLIAPTFICNSGGFISSSPLPVSGTYTILIDPSGNNVGSMTLKLVDVPPDVTGTITPRGPPVTVTTIGGRPKWRLTFGGTTGQRISLKVSGVALTGGSNQLRFLLRSRTASRWLSSATISSSGSFIDVQTLPATGNLYSGRRSARHELRQCDADSVRSAGGCHRQYHCRWGSCGCYDDSTRTEWSIVIQRYGGPTHNP